MNSLPPMLALLVWQMALPSGGTGVRPLEPIVRQVDGGAAGGVSCAMLDANVFAHAATSLRDLRLFTANAEIPYTITLSEPAEATGESAAVLNAHATSTGISFDLEMPHRPYTEVILDIGQQDFVWSADVSGANDLTMARTPLGTFPLFDLTGRHLDRSTTLPLPESTFRYLHVELRGPRISAAAIRAAEAPPSREAQILYTPIAQTGTVSQQGSETVATFRIPAHVPIERVSIEMGPGSPANFLRAVRVTGRTGVPGSPVETIAGTIARTHLATIQLDRTSLPAAMGVNLQRDATIEVAIENGPEKPLPVSFVRLEMRQRAICFARTGEPLSLFYGDPNLPAPRYPGPQLSKAVRKATLGRETRNPFFRDTVSAADHDVQTPAKGHLWVLLLICFGVGGTLASHVLRRR